MRQTDKQKMRIHCTRAWLSLLCILALFPQLASGEDPDPRILLDQVKQRYLEMKSLKIYFWSFRDQGHFHEDITNRILDDLVAATSPRWMRITGTFNIRGGIRPVITAEYPELGSAPHE